ncbi:MAG: hypothetical protein JXR66_06155 [Bacteroidales bacterium]|nr:hypothetical protein [Bacteroidales bacterium]
MKFRMNKYFIFFSITATLLSAGSCSEKEPQSSSSEWVFPSTGGKLKYKETEKGDRIMDFSHAGYMGGGVSIPDVPVKIRISPTGNDDTELIRNAIEEVSGLPLVNGFRGAVLLAPGEYIISASINIGADGVVLRGSGSGQKEGPKSTLKLSGNPFNAVSLRSGAGQRTGEGEASGTPVVRTRISDEYVPSGSSTFNVENAEGFKTGDIVLIRKPVTEEWIEFMQMHDLVRDGKPQTWIRAGSFLVAERRIAGISGNKISLEVPLSDSYDKKFTGQQGTVIELTEGSRRLSQCGIENLHIVSPEQPIPHSEPHFTALRINGEDCWARDILIEETMNSIGVTGKRITVTDVTVVRKALHQGSSRPAEFAPNGTQVLIDRCRVIAENVWFLATGSGVSGPVVILNCEFTGDQRGESHQRWSTGLLYDNVRAERGGLDFRNRGSMGSGHGWSMGWGLAWNCVAKEYVMQNPPGAHNWMIGCIGESRLMPRPFGQEPLLPEATKDSHGKHVIPASLYLAQLKERLGEDALRNILY